MRKLIYVPVIHMESDLGGAASAIESKSASLCGEERWAKHKETVVKFWDSMADYFAAVDATNLKIYQDGLVTGGALGTRIIEEGARRGSKNHQIILNLMRNGAEIRKTEDPYLLKEEYQYIAGFTHSKSATEQTTDNANYKLRKNQLTKERDKFVAKAIHETLKEGETGVLFMGSYHNVLPYLPRDIMVKQVKDREKINAYFRELVLKGEGKRLEHLAEYLCSPPTFSVEVDKE